MKTNIIMLLLLTVFAVGCKKEKTISGRVYNLVTDKGIPESQVSIYKKVKNGQFDGDPIVLSTDTDGRFTLKDKFRGSKAQGIEFENYHDSIRLFVAEPRQQKIMNGEGNVVYNLPMARLVPITLFFTDQNSQPNSIPLRIRMRSFHTDDYYPKENMSFDANLDNGSFFGPNALNNSLKFLAMEGWNYLITYGTEESSGNQWYATDSIFVDVNAHVTQSFTIQITK